MALSLAKKKIVVLGSTGSIGRNTLKVVLAFPERFAVVGLAAGSDYRTLARQARLFGPARVAMADPAAAGRLRRLLAGSSIRVVEGEEGVASLALLEDVDLIVSAIVGASGLKPTYQALRAGRDVALANKEPLVMAGRLIMAEAARSGAAIIPIDSEHHAIDMALRGLRRENVAAITLTASGGPFADTPADKLRRVTIGQALRHPRWKMGSKITIDSATLMNKGLEIIEAHWLFGFGEKDIRVVVHPESIVHGMVHLADGGVLAYMSQPDMRLPIAAALNHPETIGQGLPTLSLERLGSLTFMPPDHRRFPTIRLAREALRAGGSAPAVLNAANEVAVSAFLEGKVAFTDIFGIIGVTLDSLDTGKDESMEQILEQDRLAREAARAVVAKMARRGRHSMPDSAEVGV